MKISFNVGTIFCYECVMALQKFIGSMKGIQSVGVDEGKVSVDYDPDEVSPEKIEKIVKETVEKLGYKVLD